MPSTDAIVRNLERLYRNIRAGTLPASRDLGDLAADWSALLGDVSDTDLDAAVVAYLRGSSPWWPTPGQLLALVPARQVAALDDSAGVFEEVLTWLRHHAYRAPKPGELDADDARDTALCGALDAVGGVMAIRLMTTSDRPHVGKRYQDAYRAIRARQGVRMEGRVVARLGGPSAGRETGKAIPMRGSGFKRLGEV